MNRRLLLTGADHLTVKQWRRLTATLERCDSTNEIGTAWGVKERLRLLLNESQPSGIRWRLADFYDAALDAAMPETTRLAKTIQNWWPAILVTLTEQVTNARTEVFNRIIKQTKRVGCGYRTMAKLPASYPHPHRRHPTATSSSMTGRTPPKVQEPLIGGGRVVTLVLVEAAKTINVAVR